MYAHFPLSREINDRLSLFSASCNHIISSCQIPKKLQSIANNCFKGGTSAYLCLFSSLELYQGIISTRKMDNKETTIDKIANASKLYFNSHGGLLLGCGLFSLADALQDFGLVNFHFYGNIVSICANVLFLGASILALKENIRQFLELKKIDCKKMNIDEKELNLMKRSAFFGIISNLGYTIATASLLYNDATAFAIMIAIFSCFSGGIKIFYDISAWAQRNKGTLGTT